MSERRSAAVPEAAIAEDAATEAAPAVENSAVASALLDIAEASRATPGVEELKRPPAGALLIARARAVEADGVVIELAGKKTHATVDDSVHDAVIATACARQEMVLVTVDGDGKPCIVGALRTQPTPGVDAMDEINLAARRVTITGGEEVQLRSGVAVIALRAIGEVETYADRILSRAEEVQKIVARMLRLN